MKRAMSMEQLIELLDGDREILRDLVAEGIVEETEHGFATEEVERVLVACTLVRELEVNWAGVEIILQLRDDLLTTRRRMRVLLEHSGQTARHAGDASRDDILRELESSDGSEDDETPGA